MNGNPTQRENPPQNLALIVAMSENGVIGKDGNMPWRLSADLKRFKKLTLGHHIIMGRKTYDSIGVLLPGRITVIITRQTDFEIEGARIVHSLPQALEVAADDCCPFIVGGAEIYRAALPQVSTLYVTRVQTNIRDGDTHFPELDWTQWRLTASEQHPRDDRNDFDMTFETYERVSTG